MRRRGATFDHDMSRFGAATVSVREAGEAMIELVGIIGGGIMGSGIAEVTARSG
jgi:hypothetical protein